MKLVMVAAISKDGYLTRGSNPNPGDWTSEEDKINYNKLLNAHDIYLMGNRTYKSAKNSLPVHAHKVVMSHNPKEQPQSYDVTFTNKSFKEVIRDYETKHDSMLVIGGGSVYHQLIDQKLIDEVYLTIEPVLNGNGVLLAPNSTYFESNGFVLTDNKMINKSGTELRHYIKK